MMRVLTTLLVFSSLLSIALAQPVFYFGADLSYVNEMEDCGEVFRVGGEPQDPYQIFAENGANLVRLRLWHTPAWYDNLNEGHRYSDLADVKRSIARAHAAGMEVLLDFHLSDNWADPGKQVVPAAWAAVVDDLPVLQDSLYRYVAGTLLELHGEGLLPAMVQIGNETNRGILQSQEDNDAGWTLDWSRNAALFNRAIAAVRDVEASTGEEIVIGIHLAAPAESQWLAAGFHSNGVTDFDVIGLSYYWAWHQPTTIPDAGAVIAELRADYPDKDVIVFETGYIWTNESNDDAGNIISSVQPGYAPASPDNQRRWLVDLTQEVIDSGGKGVIYWEPAWVSSSCYTQWGQGSHQEHATFFDFDNNLLPEGGIGFYGHDYTGLVRTGEEPPSWSWRAYTGADQRQLHVALGETTEPVDSLRLRLIGMDGRVVLDAPLRVGANGSESIALPDLAAGTYVVELLADRRSVGREKLVLR